MVWRDTLKHLLVPFLFSYFNISLNNFLDLQGDLEFVFIEGYLDFSKFSFES